MMLDDWEKLEKYAEWCRCGMYQVIKNSDSLEVRIMVGRFGYIQTFDSIENEQYKRILRFCNAEGFYRIVSNIPDELFFRTLEA